MSKDPFNTDMSIADLINYIKKCPRIYVHELPDKLEKYIKVKQDEALQKYDAHLNSNSPLNHPIQSPEDQLRREIATQIMIKHAPHSAMNMEMLADYCVEGADELLKRLKQ